MHNAYGRDSFLIKREKAKDMFLQVVCAWCSVNLGTKNAEQGGQELIFISHGICPSCAKKEAKKYKLKLEKPVKRSNKQADAAFAA